MTVAATKTIAMRPSSQLHAPIKAIAMRPPNSPMNSCKKKIFVL